MRMRWPSCVRSRQRSLTTATPGGTPSPGKRSAGRGRSPAMAGPSRAPKKADRFGSAPESRPQLPATREIPEGMSGGLESRPDPGGNHDGDPRGVTRYPRCLTGEPRRRRRRARTAFELKAELPAKKSWPPGRARRAILSGGMPLAWALMSLAAHYLGWSRCRSSSRSSPAWTPNRTSAWTSDRAKTEAC